MKYTPTIEPIEITPTIRVRDYDLNQYVVERSSIVQTGENTGDLIWTVVAYCGCIKSMAAIARRYVIEDAVSEARRVSGAAFDVSGIPEKLSALPPKTGKKVGSHE